MSRAPSNSRKVLDFLQFLGTNAHGGRVYLAGGASAVIVGWRERSKFIARHGTTDFFHYDFYAQALAKIARGYDPDRGDVKAILRLKLVELETLLTLFEAIEPDLIRYPAIDPSRFREKVEAAAAWLKGDNGDRDDNFAPSA